VIKLNLFTNKNNRIFFNYILEHLKLFIEISFNFLMDLIKEAFGDIKRDITYLNEVFFNLKRELTETRESMIEICEIVKELEQKNKTLELALNEFKQTNPLNIQTNLENISTQNTLFKPLNDQILLISKGNEGVPTDRQTNQQTDRQTDIYTKKPKKEEFMETFQLSSKLDEKKENSIDNAIKILDSLDNIKKEIRLKFKRLTDQELLIFSTIYQLEEEAGEANYRIIAEKLNLTESSVRDYIGKLIKKGIPIEKNKINNKNINLSISQNLKKIASLSTILQLRGI